MTSFRYPMTAALASRRRNYPDHHDSEAFEPRPIDTPDPIEEREEFAAGRDLRWLGLACLMPAAVVITSSWLVLS